MIYLSDDYVEKYEEVFTYLFSRAIYEKYSFNHIEYKISHSPIIEELENSNVTSIAFSSLDNIYFEIFLTKENKDFKYNLNDIYGWLGYIYIHLFIDLKITWESLFIVLPIEKAINLYPTYHEMDYLHLLEYVKSLIPYSVLNNVMKYRKITCEDLSKQTNISISTIKALRYNKRDINKLSSGTLLTLSHALNVKMESLLPNIGLIFN